MLLMFRLGAEIMVSRQFFFIAEEIVWTLVGSLG